MNVDTTSYLHPLSRRDTSAKTSKSMGKEDFLRILVEQIKHQDPFNSMDPTQMIGQLTQFSMLEQLANMNVALTSSLSAQTLQAATGAVSYIGKSVMASGNTLSVKDGAVSKANYTLPKDAKTLQARIFDKNGAQVRAINIGPKVADTYDISWDGKDERGNKTADGTYFMAITGTDVKGDTLTVSSTVSGVVKGVSVKNGAIMLKLVDGREVNLTNVQSVASGNA